MSVHHPQPTPAYWIAVVILTVLGGPLLGGVLGGVLHALARMLGWLP
jgi:hypothetical protein